MARVGSQRHSPPPPIYTHTHTPTPIHTHVLSITGGQDSVADTLITLVAGDTRFESQHRLRYSSLLQIVQNGSGGQLASHVMGRGGSSHIGKMTSV
jgi:hypothetical protein